MSHPRVRIAIDAPQRIYAPGELLSFEYRLAYGADCTPSAVEVSVLWLCEGKGDEDLAVHFFDRVAKDEQPTVDFRGVHRYSVALPNSPLTYDGVLFKIGWRVRVRVFYARKEQVLVEESFRLGHVPAASPAVI